MGLLTLLDALITCADIDARAAGHGTGVPPMWLTVASNVCLALYTVEFCMWLWVLPLTRAIRDRFLLIDFFIILTGYVEIVLLAAGLTVGSFGLLRALRIVRILRLLKLFRKIPYLKELQKLVNMTSTCMKTLGWSFIFCFVIMTIWAMLIVEFVHPLILELHESKDLFGGDEQIVRAASTVMNANLLLFKTVIAGDSWGRIAVPVIEEHPATAIVFVGSLLTLVFGVLQLIVAVVVDTFAEKRERDVLNRAEEMENDIEEDKKFLQRIFDRVDEDGSGELTLEELIEGARNDPEFQSRLRVMDIDESDLQQLFLMIDVKGTGQVSPEEFIQPLSRWVHESKTANRFVKYNVMRTMHQNDELRAFTSAKFDVLSAQLQRIASSLGIPLETAPDSRRASTKKLKRTATTETLENKEPKQEKQKRKSESVGCLSSEVVWERKTTTVSQSQSVSSMGSFSRETNEIKTIAKRLSLMEAQQKLILDTLSYAPPPEANRPQLQWLQMPWDSMQLGFNPDLSQSLSSVSGRSGGVPGGAAARPGSEVSRATPTRSSSNKELPSPALHAKLSKQNLGLLEEQYRERGVEDRLAITGHHIDAALVGAMQVVEDLLQNAASQACVKAEAALRWRLESFFSEGTESSEPLKDALAVNAQVPGSKLAKPGEIKEEAFPKARVQRVQAQVRSLGEEESQGAEAATEAQL